MGVCLCPPGPLPAKPPTGETLLWFILCFWCWWTITCRQSIIERTKDSTKSKDRVLSPLYMYIKFWIYDMYMYNIYCTGSSTSTSLCYNVYKSCGYNRWYSYNWAPQFLKFTFAGGSLRKYVVSELTGRVSDNKCCILFLSPNSLIFRRSFSE